MLRLPPDAMTDLTRAFAADLPAAWRRARDRHPDQTPYAFILHGAEGGLRPRVWPAVLTVQGLERAAQTYVDRGSYETLAEARDALRWSVADGPDSDEWADRGLPAVDAAVAEHIGTDVGDEAGYRMLADAAVPAWRELDAAGTFGTGADRDRLLLGFMLSDVAKDSTLGTVLLLNPPAVAERYRSQTELPGHYRSAGGVAASPDGRALYTVGNTHDPAARPPDGDRESTHELVAYAVDGGRLVPRWAHRYQGFGDSLQAVIVDPTDGSLVVLRQRFNKRVGRATLLRFGTGSATPVATADLDAAANGRSLAVSADGTRVAVGDFAGRLWVFDRAFALLHAHPVGDKVMGATFTRSGDLLVGTRNGVGIADVRTGHRPASHTCAVQRLSADRGRSVVAVSGPAVRQRPVVKAVFAVEEADPETTVTLLRLPSLDLIRAVAIAGHQLTTATLSADGRRLAVEARPVGKWWQFVVVLDLTTGAEVVRRKVDATRDLSFVGGDGRTLAVATSGYGTGAPVDLWDLPA